MEVLVLPPQDCLKTHHHHNPTHRRRNPSPNPGYSSNHTSRSTRRNRNSNSPPPPGSTKAHPKPHISSQVLTGPIRILKRGEDFSRAPKPEPKTTRPVEAVARPSSKPGSKVDRAVKPEPELVEPSIGPMINGFYAGSACVTSPPPSELPLPAFFAKSCALVSEDVNNNQKIASDLRRVLKLC